MTFQSVKQSQSLNQHQQKLDLASTRLEELQKKHSSNQSKKQLLEELVLKKNRLTASRQFLKKVKQQINQASGMANAFATLTSMATPGIEFSNLSLQEGHSYIGIQGYAANTESVISLLQDLKHHPDLSEKEFIQLAIHPASNQNYNLAFTISNINLRNFR
ncbi:MAG: hypothetical protein V3U75_06525 [Methylococcaceae bacterium]